MSAENPLPIPETAASRDVTPVELSPEEKVRETFRHNEEMLAGKLKSATSDAAYYSQKYDGTRCLVTPVNIYVNSETGRIEDVTSVEEERREAARRHGMFVVNAELPGSITPAPVAEAPEEARDVVKVPALKAIAMPHLNADHPAGKVLINRPKSWNRNSQVILASGENAPDLDELMPDPIERGIFQRSIELYNQKPEPPEVDNK